MDEQQNKRPAAIEASNIALRGTCYRLSSYSKTMDRTMANFVITFRFKSDATYSDRYNSFAKKVVEIATTYPWAETSSFYAMECNESAQSLCDRLYFETEFDPKKDLMLVVDTKNQVKATKGKVEYPTLLKTGLGF